MSWAVIIPSRNAKNLSACLAALYSCEPEARVIVVDDGLAERPEGPRYLRGIKPFVFAHNCNLGMSIAGPADVILLNDDAQLETPGGFTAMAQAAAGYGAVSAVTNCAGNPEQFQRPGGGVRGTENLAFVCVFIPRTTIDSVGLLDGRFVTYGWEDTDYCRRIRNAGMKLGIFDGCFVDHRHLESTFRKGNGAGDIEPGRRIYLDKWGSM